jgi:hypothetical protein
LPVRATGALLFADRGYHDLATSRCRGWNGFDLFLRAAFAATVAGANDDPRNALTKATSTNELDMCTHWSCVFSCCVHSLSLSLAYCFFVGGWIQHKLMEVERGHSWRGRAIFWASPLALARTARHTRVGRGNAHIWVFHFPRTTHMGQPIPLAILLYPIPFFDRRVLRASRAIVIRFTRFLQVHATKRIDSLPWHTSVPTSFPSPPLLILSSQKQ